MTFLTPAALAFAALLAVPIVVHLFKPRRVRQTPFSSLRWLAHSPQKLSRRIRLHQLLLFAMRATFLILLVLALARPLWTSDAAPAARQRIIVLDVSRSMALKVSGRATPMERARELAAKLVESAPLGAHTRVILAGNSARWLGSPDRDASALLPELHRVEATSEDTNLATALALAKPAFAGSQGRGELIFLTDNHQGAWDADALSAFSSTAPARLHVRVIDVGVGASTNGWIVDARIIELGDPPRPLLRIEMTASGSDLQDRAQHVTGVPGEADAVRSVTLEPGRPTILQLELPTETDFRGHAAKLTLTPPDGLPDDDEFYVALDTRAALRVLLIAPETSGPVAARLGFALRTAVKSLTDSGMRSARMTTRAPSTVSTTDLSEADVVFLADVPELLESTTQALSERVRAGAGLAMFLGHRVRADWYNQNLYRPLQPDEGLLPVELGTTALAAEREKWLLPAHPSPLFAGLSDPLIGDLGDVSSSRYHRFNGVLPASSRSAAHVGGTPMLIEHRCGAGCVLVVNASPDDSFSDLPSSKIFIPLMDRMLGNLGRGKGRAFTAGQPIALAFDGVRPGERVTLLGPGEDRRTLTAGGVSVGVGESGPGVLELNALDRAGVYRVESAVGGVFCFAVNVGRGDSALAPLDHAVLRSWWQPLECGVESASEPGVQNEQRGSWPIWPVLIVIAAMVLALETMTAAWLCPKLTPPTTSLIQQQRLARRISQP